MKGKRTGYAVKSPIQQRTKEQIIRDNEVARKKKIVVEQFYPALSAATISVDEAKMLVGAMSAIIMEEVMGAMRERKMSEIYDKMVKKLAPNDERLLAIEALVNVFENETLFTAREIIEGMKGAIEHTVMKELQSRKLDTLNPDWETMLNK